MRITDIITGDVIVAILTIINVLITYLLKRKSDKNKADQNAFKTIPALNTHPIHVDIDEHIRNAKCIHMDNTTTGKIKLTSDFMVYAIECWRKPCLKFAEESQKCIDNCNTNCNECNTLYTMAMNLLTEGRSYEQLKGFEYNQEDFEAIDIFRNKFSEWNHARIERLARKLSDISLINDTYKNCGLKSYRILECVDDYMYDMYRDGMHVLSKLNGELSGKTYKNQIL